MIQPLFTHSRASLRMEFRHRIHSFIGRIMPYWLKSILSLHDALYEAPESPMHQWAEFNLPTRDNLEALFRAEEADDARRKAEPKRA